MALTAATARDRRETGDIIEPGVAANAVIYQGGLVCYDGDGFIVPAAATAGYSPCVGVSQKDVDNTGGADGALTCRIYRGIYLFTDGALPAALTVAANGNFCYASDDETVCEGNAGSRPIAGIIEDVVTGGVWVRVDNRLASGASDAAISTAGPVYSARGASTANIAALATFTVAGVDGLLYVQDERILLKDQTAPAENGIYVVGVVAGGLAPLTRALDADGADEVYAGMLILISEGTLALDTVWQLTTNDPIVVGTTGLVIAQTHEGFGLAGVIADVDGAAAAAGVEVTSSRSDHKHSLPAAVAPEDTDEAAAVAGASDNVARQNHKHMISATSGLIVQMRQYQFTAADLTAAGLTQTINLGAAMPANAYLLGWSYDLVDAFDNGAAATLDVQLGETVTDDDAFCSAFDAFTASANEGVPGGGTEGVGSHGYPCGGLQLSTLWTLNADQLLNCTNGDLTITVLFSVIA